MIELFRKNSSRFSQEISITDAWQSSACTSKDFEVSWLPKSFISGSNSRLVKLDLWLGQKHKKWEQFSLGGGRYLLCNFTKCKGFFSLKYFNAIGLSRGCHVNMTVNCPTSLLILWPEWSIIVCFLHPPDTNLYLLSMKKANSCWYRARLWGFLTYLIARYSILIKLTSQSAE